MKITFLLIPVIVSIFIDNNIFDYSITSVNGDEMQLNLYQGKKIMIVVLPSGKTASDSTLLYNLDTIGRRYHDSITIIGIPSYEDGYADDSLQSIVQWYRSFLNENIVISQGMNTRKLSPYQDPLFEWLTHKEKNGHFDEDVMGAGEKFFINEQGDLYGLFSPGGVVNDDMIQQMLNQ